MVVAHRLQVDAGHEGADLRHDIEKTVLGQPLEGFANRRAADPEAFGDARFGKRGAGLELDRDDALAQLAVDVRAHPARRAGAAKGRQRDILIGTEHVH